MKKAIFIPTIITIFMATLVSCSKSSLSPAYDDKGGLSNSSSSSGSDDAFDRKSGSQSEDTSKPKGADDSTKSGTGGSSVNTPVPGTWKVTFYYDKTKDETSDYAGYSFVFNTNGTMSATKGTATTNGTWKEYTANGVQRFAITLGTTTKPLADLNDDWQLVSKTATEIKLKDNNPAKNEQLVFSKQ